MIFANIRDTPGYFYAIGYTLSLIMVLSSTRSLRGKTGKILTCCAAGIFFSALLYWTKGATGFLFILSVLLVAGAMFLGLWVNTRRVRKSLFLTGIVFVQGEFLSSLTWQICFSVGAHNGIFQQRLWFAGLMALAFLGTAGALFLISRRVYRERIALEYTWQEVLSELLIVAGVYTVSNLGYVAPDTIFSGSQARDIFAIRTLVDFSGLIILHSYHLQLMDIQRRLEQDTMHNIQEMQYRAYQISRESMEMVNSKYHDLKHQIALLRSETGMGKPAEYLDRMEKELSSYAAENNTGNQVLDAVLTNKSHSCHTRGIEFKYMVDGHQLSFMEDMEVAALFGNMLDNAIEAAERVPEEDKRLIRLQMSGERGFLCILLENTFAESLRFDEGLPLTTKADKRYHGFGMKSMLRTVNKYGGSLVTAQRDNWFELKILIPLEGKKRPG